MFCRLLSNGQDVEDALKALVGAEIGDQRLVVDYAQSLKSGRTDPPQPPSAAAPRSSSADTSGKCQ